MALQTKDPSTAIISSVGTAQSGGTTTSTKPVITGKADAGNIVVIYDGIKPLGSVVAAADGSWSFTPTADLKAGAHNFAAIAHDTAGNFGASSAVVNVTVASTVLPAPATPTLTDDAGLPIVAGGATADVHPHINGTGTAGNIVTVYDGATPLGSVKVGGDGKWTFTPATDLTNGTHAINATEKAPGGTESAHSGNVGFTVDTSIPEEPIIVSGKDYNAQGGLIDTIYSGAIIPASSVTITGTAFNSSVVYIYDGSKLIGSTQANQRGDWSYSNTAYSNGVHDLTATIKNAAGTESAHSDPFSFTVNTSVPATPTAPTMTDDSGATIPAGGTTADAHPHINGNGTAGDTITVYDNGTAIGSTTVKPDGTWSFTPVPDLGPGPHDITVTDTNAAGTPSQPSNPIHVVIDTSVPGAPTTPVLTNDSGAVIPGGSTTNDGHPHISGTGTAGDIIKIYDGATVIGSVKVDGNGKWTFTPTTDLSNAAHSISVTEVNTAGTESPHSTAIGFTVDTTLPNAPTITLMNDFRFDNGALISAVPSGSTVTSANVSFGGQATANGVVYVYDGNTMIASVKADATGYWFYASKAYANGLHDMSATQKSPAGVETAHSNHWSFTVNAVTPATPTVPVITNDAGTAIPSGGTTNDAHPHIAGTGTAGDVITVLDNGNVIGSTTVAGNGTWSFTPATDLANGVNAITVIETNSAGNASAVSPAATITIDTSVPAKPPVPVLTDDSGASIPAGSTTNDGHPHISGTGKAGDIITVYDGATALGSVKIGGDGKWTFTPSADMSTGAHSISVTDTNAAGTTGPKSDAIAFTYSVVAGAPVITSIVDAVGTITGPIVNGGVTDDNHPTISGTGVPGYTIWIYQNGVGCGDAVVDSTGHWSVKLKGALSEGLHVMTATQFTGGVTESTPSNSWNITVDTSVPKTPVAPTLTDDSGAAIAAGSTTADAHPHINGNGTAGDTITVYDGGKAIGSTTVKPDGTWSFTPSPDLSSGTHDITTTETNAAGTPSLPSNPTHITIDTSVPAAPPVPVLTDDSGALIPAGSTTNDGHPHISGTGTAGDIIAVYDGATALGSVKIGGDGKWTFTPTTDLATGAHSINVTDTNAAGTTGPHSGSIDFNLSLVPGAPVITALADATGPNVGNIAQGGLATDSQPTLKGTGHAGDTIKVYDGATLLGSTTVGSDGTWNFKPATALAYGSHSLTATESNASGTSVASAVYAFRNTGVMITSMTDHNGNPIANGGSTDGEITVTGWIDPAAAAAGMRVAMSGGVMGGTSTGMLNTGITIVGNVFTFKINSQVWDGNLNHSGLGPGTYTIDVQGALGATTYNFPGGGLSWSVTDSFTYSGIPLAPAVPVLTDDNGAVIPAGSTTADGHPHISGTGTAGDIITVYDGATAIGSVKIGSDGKWTFTPSSDLSNATHSITVTDTNAAGTSPHSGAISITIDTSVPAKPPVPVLTDDSGALIPAGSTTNDGHPHISGTGTAGDIITVYDGATALGSVKIGGDGKWTFTPSSDVSTGAHSISVTDTNAAGTTGPKSDAIAFNFSLVAGAPVITSVVDAVGTITGPIVNGGVTDDNQPTISGTGVPGYILYIYQNGAGCGQTTVDATGHWSLKLPNAMSEGLHVMTATQFMPGNAESVASNSWSITIDTSVPKTPAAPTLTDDSGAAIAAGSTTADAHPHINGNGTAGDTITVYDGGKAIGSTTVKPDGTWSFTPSPDLSSGTHDITTTETNAAGTPSLPSNPTHIVIDTSAPATPAAPILTDDAGAAISSSVPTPDATPHISGKGTAGDTITVYDGQTVLGTAKVDASGNWTFTPSTPLNTGAHSFTVVATNPAGTSSAASPATGMTLQAPSITITGIYDSAGHLIPDNGSLTGTMTVTGTVVGFASGDRVVISVDGPTVNSVFATSYVVVDVVNGHFTFTFSGDTVTSAQLFNGPGAFSFTALAQHVLGGAAKAYANSAAYHVTDTNWTYAVVPTAPAVPVLTDDNGAVISAGSTTNGHPHISGTGTAGDIITVYDGATAIGSVKIGSDGKWTFTPSSDLSNATHSITVTDTNAAGTSPHSGAISITVNTSVPAKPPVPVLTDDSGASIPAGSTTNDGHPHISGTGTVGDIIKVYDGSTILGSVKIGSDGKWTFTPSTDVSVGAHSISVTDTNAVGTTGPRSDAIAFTFSLVPGAPAITSVVDAVGTITGPIVNGGVTDDSHPTVSGTGIAGNTIYIYQNGAGCGQTTVDATGHWSLKLTSALSDGLHVMTATQFSNLSYPSSLSNSWSITVNTSAPATPAAPTLTDDSGAAIPAGSTTAAAHPHISGKGAAGDIITVYDGSTVLGSVKVDTNGNWTFTPSSDLSRAGHDFSVTETNSVGTSSAHSATTHIDISSTPSVGMFSWNGVDYVPESVIMKAYDASVPLIISGTGIPGSTFDLVGQNDGMEYYSRNPVTVAQNGTWSLSLFNSSAHFVVWTEYQGQKSAPQGIFLNPNSKDPNYSFQVYSIVDSHGSSILDGGSTSDRQPIVSGKMQGNFLNSYNVPGGVGDIIYLMDGGRPIGSAVVGADYWWHVTPSTPLSSGNHTLTVVSLHMGGAMGTQLPVGTISVSYSVSSTLHSVENAVVDDHASQSALSTSDSDQDSTSHHTVVGEHDAFKGTTGHDTVDLNADPTSYFKETTAHIEGSTVHPLDTTGVPAVNTLHLTGDHQVLDLTSLTGQTAAAKISGIEAIDLGGHANNLKLSLVDVLNLGEADLFMKDGKQQMMVKGADGDTVDLSNAHIAGVADGQWQAHGTAEVGGVVYNVYEHSGAHTELLVQQGVQIVVH